MSKFVVLIEYRMNETIQQIKKKDSIFESDILDSELRILDWIFYQVCKDQQKNWPHCDYSGSNNYLALKSEQYYILDMDILFPFLTSADGPAYHGRTCISPSLIPHASKHKIIYYLIDRRSLSSHYLPIRNLKKIFITF